jgi:hypothetical protein
LKKELLVLESCEGKSKFYKGSKSIIMYHSVSHYPRACYRITEAMTIML